MLQDLTDVLLTAERLADRVADLCGRGEPADNELADLDRAVRTVVAGWPDGAPPAALARCRALAERVAVATAVAEQQKAVVAAELGLLAAQNRVRRAYVRPPT